MLNVIDFPQPDGPTRTMNSSSRTSTVVLSTATTSPKCFDTFFSVICSIPSTPSPVHGFRSVRRPSGLYIFYLFSFDAKTSLPACRKGSLPLCEDETFDRFRDALLIV